MRREGELRAGSEVERLGGAEGEQWAAAFAKVLEEPKVECGPAEERAGAFAEGLGGAEGEEGLEDANYANEEMQAVALPRLRQACL